MLGVQKTGQVPAANFDFCVRSAMASTRPRNAVSSRTVPTPVRVDILQEYLCGYETTEKEYLIAGFTNNFKIPCTNVKFKGNHQSVRLNPDIVNEMIAKETQKGRVNVPFENPPSDQFCISPLGLIPKKEKDKF